MRMVNCEIHGFKWEPQPSVRLCPKCEAEHWHGKWMEQGDTLHDLQLLAGEAIGQLRALAEQFDASPGMIVPPGVRAVLAKTEPLDS